jgi:hypothetical protein
MLLTSVLRMFNKSLKTSLILFLKLLHFSLHLLSFLFHILKKQLILFLKQLILLLKLFCSCKNFFSFCKALFVLNLKLFNQFGLLRTRFSCLLNQIWYFFKDQWMWVMDSFKNWGNSGVNLLDEIYNFVKADFIKGVFSL